MKGRKRHRLVDTMGLLLAVVVHTASLQNRDGARLVLEKARQIWTRLLVIWVDGAYGGSLFNWVWQACGWLLEVVKKPERQTTFQVLPHRWIVERTLAWLGGYRRLSKDYEFRTDGSATMIHVAMIHLMLGRTRRRC